MTRWNIIVAFAMGLVAPAASNSVIQEVKQRLSEASAKLISLEADIKKDLVFLPNPLKTNYYHFKLFGERTRIERTIKYTESQTNHVTEIYDGTSEQSVESRTNDPSQGFSVSILGQDGRVSEVTNILTGSYFLGTKRTIDAFLWDQAELLPSEGALVKLRTRTDDGRETILTFDRKLGVVTEWKEVRPGSNRTHVAVHTVTESKTIDGVVVPTAIHYQSHALKGGTEQPLVTLDLTATNIKLNGCNEEDFVHVKPASGSVETHDTKSGERYYRHWSGGKTEMSQPESPSNWKPILWIAGLTAVVLGALIAFRSLLLRRKGAV